MSMRVVVAVGLVAWWAAALVPGRFFSGRPSGRGGAFQATPVPETDYFRAFDKLLGGRMLLTAAACLRSKLALVGDKDLEELNGYAAALQPHTEYLRPSGQLMVREALEMAFLAHLGQLRRSGEPYITHPVEVAKILAGTQMDRDTIIAGLLHDTVEDTELTFENVEAAFGPVVRKIVEGETKVSKLPKIARDEREELRRTSPSWREEEQLENMRSMFIAMAEDWRIVVVKLADRLHNIRTLEFMPPHKRLSISRETLEIFAPLAHRLGMWQFKTELEETCFRNLFPHEYDVLRSTIASKRRACETTLRTAKDQLEALLVGDEWLHERIRTIQIEGRTKSTYSTWKKMRRHGVELERIDDLIALRVVLRADEDASRHSKVDDIALCYHVLGKVHGYWTPLPRTLKDYISSPKPNGYRSLHTTVLVGSQPLEIQIRTEAMHRVAELGAAAHWAYKDSSASLPWLAIIREWHAQVNSSSVFMSLVRNELLGTRVFCFAPHGRILNLAKGATLGEAMHLVDDDDERPARAAPAVNGVAADLHYELVNGDIISYVVLGANNNKNTDDDETRLATINGLSVINSPPAPDALAPAPDTIKPGTRQRRWTLCECCLPLPGDPVKGCSGADDHNRVHRADVECASLRRELKYPGAQLTTKHHRSYPHPGGMMPAPAPTSAILEALEPDKAIRGVDGERVGFKTAFVVFCHDRTKMLLDLSLAVSAVNIVDVNSETLAPRGQAAFQYTVHVNNVDELHALIRDVKTVPDVINIVRGTMKGLKLKGETAFWALGRPPP